MNVAARKVEPESSPRVAVAPDVAVVGEVRLLTCGSVDDGKSTLIGRLLWDASHLHDDQRAALTRSKRAGTMTGEELDFSLLVDGLQAEREQGITIDIAWRYFDSGSRRFVIIDSPGHEQYTRNMATGASHADVAILLIDARHGVKRQTRRHAAICNLVGIRKVVLAVNKMDMVGYSEARYREIEAEFYTMVQSFAFEHVAAIPVAALPGDNVVHRSVSMAWYDGPTLLDYLSALDPLQHAIDAPFRMPVQLVLRDGDFRGYAGTVVSGRIRVGNALVEPLSGMAAHVTRIATMDGDRHEARRGDAVTLALSVDLDISRGAILSHPEGPPVAANAIDARMVWLSEQPFDATGSYLFRSATDIVPVADMSVYALIDFETLTVHGSETCAANDIADCRIVLGRPTALDRFADLAGTGAFVLVDAISGATVAGGVVTDATAGAQVTRNVFVLDRTTLASGLCADLGDTSADRQEFVRRAHEAAILLRRGGLPVLLDL